jgi:hypothetical protein
MQILSFDPATSIPDARARFLTPPIRPTAQEQSNDQLESLAQRMGGWGTAPVDAGQP